MTVSIRFVAIINADNSPLYLKSFDNATNDTSDSEDRELRYYFLAHMSLDYVITQLTISENPKAYALLLVHDGIAVYGSLSNTGIKFLIGTDAHDNLRFDIRPTLNAFQKAYISYVCNPFHDPFDHGPIKSKTFENHIKTVTDAWNSSAAVASGN